MCGFSSFDDDVEMMRLGQSYECDGLEECPGMA